MDQAPGTLPESLRFAAERFPERGIGIFDARGRNVERRTYRELVDSVERAAARLSTHGIRADDRVVVSLPSSWDWMDGWLGALLLGALPVAYPPAGAMGSPEGHATRLETVLDRIGCRTVVGNTALRGDLEKAGAQQAAAAVITPQELQELGPRDFKTPRPRPEQTAFLQFTSGSIGQPRAVMIPHRAALHNSEVSNEAIGIPWGAPAGEWAESMVSWLPLHHDMGLVGCLFLCLRLGLDLWLMNPTTFLARPRLWLDQLSLRGVTFAPAPNFGYQLCVERLRPDELDELDLSGWRAAMTGAEMIRYETATAFSDLTARCGFKPEAFRPCYGLAEGTLAVTFDVEGRGLRTLPMPKGADAGLGLSEAVSVGPPVRDTALRICAPDGSAVPDGSIGEVRVKGPGVFTGYYNDPEGTAEGLRDGWLCTGDLGFLERGELYLTGRVKDLLIIRGNNVMPHELEWVAESVVGGGGSQRCGVFSVARGAEGEQAVVVIETTEKRPEALKALAGEVRRRIGREMFLPLADVVFVRRGKIPKTTSGKVQRRQLRERYIAGELERLAV